MIAAHEQQLRHPTDWQQSAAALARWQIAKP
jgi:hypothetical protein